MPHINPQQKPRIVRRHIRQHAQRNHIIQPVIPLIARLENCSQVQISIRLRGAACLEENVRAVVRLEVVAGVCAEDAGLDVGQAPVGAYVENFAAETGAGEVAAYDRTEERG